MKVYTKLVMNWDGDVLEEESFEYDGPVTEMKGGGDTKTTQTAEPSKIAKPHLKNIYGQARSLYESGGQQYFPGQTYASRDPYENLGQQMALNYATGPMQHTANTMMGAQRSALMAPNVANNPYVGGMADVIQNRMMRGLSEEALPMIRGGAIASGQLGGSRQGIAEGQAIGRTAEAMGDATAKLYHDAYSKGLDAQSKALLTAPNILQAGLQPSQAVGDVGAYMRGEREMALQDEINRWNFAQQQPYDALNFYNSIVSGAPWSTTSKADMGSRGGFSPTGALGGAMAGAGLGPIGMIGGGLLGGFF